MKLNNLFELLPSNLDDEVFESLLDAENIKIERIVSNGHTTPKNEWYDQHRSEWVMLLKGRAKLEFESGDDVALKPGDYITIPAHQRHRVAWTAPDTETIWLAVHYHS